MHKQHAAGLLHAHTCCQSMASQFPTSYASSRTLILLVGTWFSTPRTTDMDKGLNKEVISRQTACKQSRLSHPSFFVSVHVISNQRHECRHWHCAIHIQNSGLLFASRMLILRHCAPSCAVLWTLRHVYIHFNIFVSAQLFLSAHFHEWFPLSPPDQHDNAQGKKHQI